MIFEGQSLVHQRKHPKTDNRCSGGSGTLQSNREAFSAQDGLKAGSEVHKESRKTRQSIYMFKEINKKSLKDKSNAKETKYYFSHEM